MDKRTRTKEILAFTPKKEGKLLDCSKLFEQRMYANLSRNKTKKTTFCTIFTLFRGGK